jgi:MFS family permease
MKSILKNRNFVFLWFGQMVEQIGDSFTLMALIAWAMSIKENGTSAGNMSLLMFWIGLPILMLGPLAGVIIDRFKRKNIMLTAAFARGLVIFAIFLLIKDNARGAFVYTGVFMISVISQFFIPAKSSLIPDIVTEKELMDANSISATTTVIVQILTYAIGGVIIAEIGHQKAMLINAFIYAAVVLILLFVSPKEKHRENIKPTVAQVWDDFTHGLTYLLENKKVAFVVRRVFLLMIAVGLFYISLTGHFMDQILSFTGMRMKAIKALGFMQAFLGIGLIAGMFMVQSLLKWVKEEFLIRFIYPVLGALVITLVIWPDYYYLIFVAVASGMAAVMIISIAETSIQKYTPPALRGRIFSTYYILRGAGLAAATSATGLLAKVMKEEHIVLMAGAGLFIYGVISFILMLVNKPKES